MLRIGVWDFAQSSHRITTVCSKLPQPSLKMSRQSGCTPGRGSRLAALQYIAGLQEFAQSSHRITTVDSSGFASKC